MVSFRRTNNVGWNKTTVTRVDVNFSITGKSIDNYIGRKAHISFLSNSGFLTMFVNRFKETLFDTQTQNIT